MGLFGHSGSNWERTKEKASQHAERATASQPFQVNFDVARRTGSDMVAALDDEMEKRGYVFSGWLSSGEISFKYLGLEEVERKKKERANTLYSGLAYIVTDIDTFRHPTKQAGQTLVALSSDGLTLGGELKIPIKNIVGYGVHQKSNPSFLAGAIVLRGGYSGEPGPTALVVYIGAHDRFQEAMVEIGIPKIEVWIGVYWASQ